MAEGGSPVRGDDQTVVEDELQETPQEALQEHLQSPAPSPPRPQEPLQQPVQRMRVTEQEKTRETVRHENKRVQQFKVWMGETVGGEEEVGEEGEEEKPATRFSERIEILHGKDGERLAVVEWELQIPAAGGQHQPSTSEDQQHQPTDTRVRTQCLRRLVRGVACIADEMQKLNVAALTLQVGPADQAASTSEGPENTQIEGTPVLGYTLLQAVVKGNVKDVRWLLERNASTSAISKCGRTALMSAAEAGRADIVAILLDAGASPRLWNPNGRTALHHALIHSRGVRCVALLIAAGAHVNKQDMQGVAPLHLAARTGNEAAIRELLAAGADKGLKDAQGRTARDLANGRIVRKLLE